MERDINKLLTGLIVMAVEFAHTEKAYKGVIDAKERIFELFERVVKERDKALEEVQYLREVNSELGERVSALQLSRRKARIEELNPYKDLLLEAGVAEGMFGVMLTTLVDERDLLKEQARQLQLEKELAYRWLALIRDIAYDKDGYTSAEDLSELVGELYQLAKMGLDGTENFDR